MNWISCISAYRSHLHHRDAMSKRSTKKKGCVKRAHPHVEAYNDLVAAYKEAFPDMSHQQVVLFWQNCNFVHLRVCFCDTFLKIFYFFLNIACFYFYFCIIIFRNHFSAVVAFFDDFISSEWSTNIDHWFLL